MLDKNREKKKERTVPTPQTGIRSTLRIIGRGGDPAAAMAANISIVSHAGHRLHEVRYHRECVRYNIGRRELI
ncbi:MAG: hypothetical protein FWD92_03505 [Methanomassiliicoccaceae archaeon]|nr:hypothetical protein [Methanomassiliicoccaceae archaeon]